MELRNVITVAATVVVFGVFKVVSGGGGLSFDFYRESCPQVEDIVRDGVQSLSLADPTSPAALIRLFFHDCQVQGCDASILVDPTTVLSTPYEMAASRNFGIRKRESIGLIKSMVEAACPRQVSCADILVLASREAVAVAVAGGPVIRVPMGRRDSTAVPSGKLAQALLPPSDIGVDGMLFLFADKGMTVEESVAIMGAHTLGVTHCFNIQNRLRNRRRGFEMLLKLSCPLGSFTPNTSFVLNDPTTPLLFDTNYYFNAASGRGVLRIDSEMPFDPRTTRFVERFASDPAHFFQVFSSAFVKLSSYRVLTGDKGTVRNECSVIN